MAISKQRSWRHLIFPIALFALGFILVTLRQSDYGRSIPGDMGDARFNLIVLEHLYRWATGLDKSLWSPDFFYPYAGTLSFSDNHFGTGIAYILPRLLQVTPEHAFITWYSLASALNYFACYGSLRKLSLKPAGSAAGAFVFTFSLCVSAQYGHAQLVYRFATPLAMAALIRFQEKPDSRELLKFYVFTTIQFLCSIYIGYFLCLLAAAFVLSNYLIQSTASASPRLRNSLLANLQKAAAGDDLILLFGIVICTVALGFLFIPYIYYSHLYGFHRNSAEILTMTPRLASYLLSDGSYIWHGLSSKLSVPMRWEHQMFFGASAVALAATGLVAAPSIQNKRVATALFFLILLTLNIHNHSLYRLLTHFPLSNSIRAVSRICLVMVFPIGMLAGSGFDWLTSREPEGSIRRMWLAVGCCLLIFMIYEYATYSGGSVPVTTLQQRWQALTARISAPPQQDAILYVPDRFEESFGFNELDGMRLGQMLNRSTLNGYSGNAPNGFGTPLPDPCQKVNQRLADYVLFTKQGEQEFKLLVNRVYLLDTITRCTPDASLLHRTHFTGALSSDTMKRFTISIQAISQQHDHLFAKFRIENHSDTLLAAVSDDNHPIHISWRYVPVGKSMDSNANWNGRMALTSDIRPGSDQSLDIQLDTPTSPGLYHLEASVVQEGVAWFQAAGMPIARSAQIIDVGSGTPTSIVDRKTVTSEK